MSKVLILLDGKAYEITDVESITMSQAKFEDDYDTVVTISTSVVEQPEPGKEADGVGKPSSGGVTPPQEGQSVPLFSSVGRDAVDDRRKDLGVTVLEAPGGRKIVKSLMLKTKAVKLTAVNPVMKSAMNLVEKEKAVLKKGEAIVVTQPPEIHMRKASLYITEKVDVCESKTRK